MQEAEEALCYHFPMPLLSSNEMYWMADEQRERPREKQLRLRRWQEHMKDRIWKAFNDWFVATTGIVDMETPCLPSTSLRAKQRITPSGRSVAATSLRTRASTSGGRSTYRVTFLTSAILFHSQMEASAAPQRDACWLARHRGHEARCYQFENAVIFAKGLEKEVPFYDTQTKSIHSKYTSQYTYRTYRTNAF